MRSVFRSTHELRKHSKHVTDVNLGFSVDEPDPGLGALALGDKGSLGCRYHGEVGLGSGAIKTEGL